MISVMADYRWRFDADARSGARASTVIHQLNQNILILTRSTRDAEKRNTTWARSWTHLAGVFNTWNKAVRFAIDDVKKLGAIFGSIGQGIMRVFAPLQQITNEIQVLAKASGTADMQTLLDRIDALAASTPRTATEIAVMARSMLRAGKTAKDTADALDDVIAASVGLGIDADQAFSTANSAMSKFAGNLGFTVKAGDEMKDVLSYITGAANSANTSFTELSSALQRGRSGGLQLFNVSLLETLTAMDVLANSGMRGSRAMTNLSSSLILVVRHKKKLEEMGIEVANQNGQFKTLSELVGEFNRVLSDKTPEKQASVLTEIFGTQAGIMKVLMRTGSEAFDAMTDRIHDASGALDELVDAQGKSIIGQQKLLESAKESVLKQLGVLFDPLIQEWLGTQATMIQGFSEKLKTFVDDVLAKFQELKGAGQDTLKAWVNAIVGTGFGPVIQGIRDLKDQILEEFQTLRPAFAKFWAVVTDLGKQAFAAVFTDDVMEEIKRIGNVIGDTIGKSIVRGMKTATVNGARGVAAWTGDVMDALLDAGKRGSVTLANAQIGLLSGGLLTSNTGGTVPNVASGRPLPPVSPPSATKPTTEEILLDSEIAATFERIQEAAAKTTHTKAQEVGLTAAQLQQMEELEEYETSVASERKNQLQASVDLTKQQAEYNALIGEAATVQDKLTMQLNDYGTQFKKWLLEPWDTFTQALLTVKNRFAEILGNLKGTRIDLLEKVGLVSGDRAGQLRQQLAEQNFLATQRRMSLAQSPEERASLQEQLASQAAGLYEMGGTHYAYDAQRYIEEAIRNRQVQQDLEEKKIALERDLAEKNIPILEGMIAKTSTATQEAELLKKLDEAYRSLGLSEKSLGLQGRITAAEQQASGESVDLLKQLVELGKQSLEVQKQKLTEQSDKLSELLDQGPIVLDPSLQMA